MVPFRVTFRAGVPLFEQVVYAATRAMVSGQLRPGDAFPSVRTLSRDLKINPNTAHKIVAHLVNEGLLETRPGIGTVVAVLPDSTRKQRTELLGHEIEELVVEAKRLGIELAEMLDSFTAHWKRLTAGQNPDSNPNPLHADQPAPEAATPGDGESEEE
jgi:GntR family transcriptional regulator